jgi:hypothetical protein
MARSCLILPPMHPHNPHQPIEPTSHPQLYLPTHLCMRTYMQLHLQDTHWNCVRFRHPGHGSQQTDYSGDELDGSDETILPTDYESAGQIVDDELNDLLVKPLLPGVTLHALMDCCHSGTVLDLPYRCKGSGGKFDWKVRWRPACWFGRQLLVCTVSKCHKFSAGMCPVLCLAFPVPCLAFAKEGPP